MTMSGPKRQISVRTYKCICKCKYKYAYVWVKGKENLQRNASTQACIHIFLEARQQEIIIGNLCPSVVYTNGNANCNHDYNRNGLTRLCWPVVGFVCVFFVIFILKHLKTTGKVHGIQEILRFMPPSTYTYIIYYLCSMFVCTYICVSITVIIGVKGIHM